MEIRNLVRRDGISHVQGGVPMKLFQTHSLYHKTLKIHSLADFKILSFYRQSQTDGIPSEERCFLNKTENKHKAFPSPGTLTGSACGAFILLNYNVTSLVYKVCAKPTKHHNTPVLPALWVYLISAFLSNTGRDV